MLLFKKVFKKLPPILISFILAIGFSVSLQSILAAWTPPTADPPSGNVNPPIYNVGTPINQIVGTDLGVTGDFLVGTNAFYVDEANSKVSIGTANIGESDQELNIVADEPYILIRRNASIGQMGLLFKEASHAQGQFTWSQYVPNNSYDLAFNNGSDRVIFKSTGNVGIGTIDPHNPAPNNQSGNMDVNDIYVRSVGTAGKWISQVGWAPNDVKLTTTTHDGSFGGYYNMYQWVQIVDGSAYAGYHVCDATELTRWYQTHTSPIDSGWYNGGIQSYSPGNEDEDDCVGWSQNGNNKWGFIWIQNSSYESNPEPSVCSYSRHVFVCK